MSEVTRLLEAAASGDRQAAGEILPLVYAELRDLAAARLNSEPDGHTLQPTALVHEAYLKLVGNEDRERWENRGHFFAAAAEAMRRILVDHARRKKAVRHGGMLNRLELVEGISPIKEPQEELLAIDAALDQLAIKDPIKAEIVKLRYFVGLTLPETSAALGLSERTAGRHWSFARAWLRRAVEASEKNS